MSWLGAPVRTPFTLYYADGTEACHSPVNADKQRMSARNVRLAADLFVTTATLGGLHVAGRWTDATTGETGLGINSEASRLPAGTSKAEYAAWSMTVVDKGHVIPADIGGPYCICNLLPMRRDLNLSLDNAPIDHIEIEMRQFIREAFIMTAPRFKVRKLA